MTQAVPQPFTEIDMELNTESTRAYLKAKRDFYGALTDEGHGCSNILELLENREKAESAWQMVNIEIDIGRQIERLEKLCAAAQAVDG